MARAIVHRIAALCFAVATAGCAGRGGSPPPELAGLWSAGSAACAAGVGVRFGADEIAAFYEASSQTLFDRPRYRVEAQGENFRVRIQYDLPRLPGGAVSVGARGVLVLERAPDGALRPQSHNLVDARTGSARLRMINDPALRTLTLKPCGAQPWIGGLRGREDA